MLRFSLGVTEMDRIRNEHIREGQHRSDTLEIKLGRPEGAGLDVCRGCTVNLLIEGSSR